MSSYEEILNQARKERSNCDDDWSNLIGPAKGSEYLYKEKSLHRHTGNLKLPPIVRNSTKPIEQETVERSNKKADAFARFLETKPTPTPQQIRDFLGAL